MPEDRVALVTGAARGIGAATVTRLCDQGYRVIALDSCGIGGERAGVTYPLARELDLRAIAQARRDRLIRVKERCRADLRGQGSLAGHASPRGGDSCTVGYAGLLRQVQPARSTCAQVLTSTRSHVDYRALTCTALIHIPAVLRDDNGMCSYSSGIVSCPDSATERPASSRRLCRLVEIGVVTRREPRQWGMTKQVVLLDPGSVSAGIPITCRTV
jgi:hypothetical protein